ncbi:alpha-L-rhamnosidase-related protein [Pedobacter sp.]
MIRSDFSFKELVRTMFDSTIFYTAKKLLPMVFLVLLADFSKAQVTSPSIVYPTVSLNAEWISFPGAAPKDYGVYHLRKTFELDTKPETFVVHLTGDQRYRLYVNGVPVVLGSARGDLRNWYYETIDIAPNLKAGKNVLAVLLWNMGSGAPAAQVSFQTGFILQGNGEREKLVNTDKSWRVIKNEAYFPEPFPASRLASYIVGSCDSVAFKKYPFGWEQPAYNDGTWSVPALEPKPRYFNVKRNLIPRSIPMMEEKLEPIHGIVRVLNLDARKIIGTFEKNGSITIPANTKATILFDIKNLTTAYPEVTFSRGENAKVQITYAESLFDQNNLKGNRNQVEGKQIKGYYDVFLADGGSSRLFRPLWMRTFRYIQFDVETKDEPLTFDKLQSMFTAYPLKENGRFSTNDASLEQIWNVGWRTARLCANETYMDCPYYEQLQYVGDTRIQALISLYVSGDDRLVRNAIEQFHQSRVPDGLTRDAYPAGGGKFIPPFSLFWISMIYDYAWYRDDKVFVDRYLIPMESILKWFEYRLDPKLGLLGKTDYWNFVDWTFSPSGIPPGGIDGNSSILSLHYAYTLDQAATLFNYSGQTQKADYYSALSKKIKEAVFKSCYDGQKGLLADSPDKTAFSQHANIWGILSDCIPSGQQKQVMEKVMNDTTLTSSTLYFRFYYTAALKKAGMGNQYLSTLGPWKEMLSLGLSTFPETLSPTVRSDCHAWSASPCYDFLATVCGIAPGEMGFRTVSIQPNLGELKEASGEMPHPLGPIKVSYKKLRDGSYTANVDLPSRMKGEFIAGGKKVLLIAGRQQISFK